MGTRSGVILYTTFMVLFQGRMCQCMLHLVLWSHIGCTYALPCCRTPQHRRTFITVSISLRNDLGDQVFDSVELTGFKSGANDILLA